MGFSAVLEIIAAALSIWASKEKRKYIDQMTSLETNYHAELNKPRAQQSDAVLDDIEFELRQLARNVAADIRASNPQA